jgi:CheY-like chemotaxis protein
VTLPSALREEVEAAEVDAANHHVAADDRLDGVRVLVVEDDADTRDVVSNLLATHGATVEGADSVASALEKLRRAPPDVVVSDIGMPDESGLSLARRLRAEIPGGADIPAVALTAYARPQDERNALAAGFDRYVSKPSPPDVLARTVHELVASKRNELRRLASAKP